MKKKKIVTRSVSALMLVSILSGAALEVGVTGTHAFAESTNVAAQTSSDVNGTVGNTEVKFNAATGELTIGNTTTSNQTFSGESMRDYIKTNIPGFRTDIKTVSIVKHSSQPNTVVTGTMKEMFSGLSAVTSISGLNTLDTSNVTDMQSMFEGMSSLTSLDVSNFDTSNVTNMYYMFTNMSSLTSLDVSNFDTSNVRNMGGMFRSTSSLTSLDVSNFDTSNVTNMGSMFNGMSSLTSLDVSNFDTSNVTLMQAMFSDMSSLTSLDVSNLDTSNATRKDAIFRNAEKLSTLVLSPNMKSLADAELPEIASSGDYTGNWDNGKGFVGTTSELLALYDGSQAGTFTWQKVAPTPAADVTVKYVDESGKPISQNVILKGNIGETYTSTEKAITGYTFKEIQGNASGSFTATPQTVTYVYKKDAVAQSPVGVYRLYNKKSMEHLYTADKNEYDKLPQLSKDWVREGVNFKAYKKSDSNTKPIYRVYNPKSGEHLNTADSYEVSVLKTKGWRSEGISYYTPKTGGKPIYRLFNPAAGIGAHFVTGDAYEKDVLVKKGWKYEGIAWNAVK